MEDLEFRLECAKIAKDILIACSKDNLTLGTRNDSENLAALNNDFKELFTNIWKVSGC